MVAEALTIDVGCAKCRIKLIVPAAAPACGTHTRLKLSHVLKPVRCLFRQLSPLSLAGCNAVLRLRLTVLAISGGST